MLFATGGTGWFFSLKPIVRVAKDAGRETPIVSGRGYGSTVITSHFDYCISCILAVKKSMKVRTLAERYFRLG